MRAIASTNFHSHGQWKAMRHHAAKYCFFVCLIPEYEQYVDKFRALIMYSQHEGSDWMISWRKEFTSTPAQNCEIISAMIVTTAFRCGVCSCADARLIRAYHASVELNSMRQLRGLSFVLSALLEINMHCDCVATLKTPR